MQKITLSWSRLASEHHKSGCSGRGPWVWLKELWRRWSRGAAAAVTNQADGRANIYNGLKIQRVHAYEVVGVTSRNFAKRCGYMAEMITWTIILEGLSPTKFGRAKNVQNSATSTLIANISGMDRHENRKTVINYKPSPIRWNKFGEIWPTNKKVIGVNVNSPKWTLYRRLHSGP